MLTEKGKFLGLFEIFATYYVHDCIYILPILFILNTMVKNLERHKIIIKPSLPRTICQLVNCRKEVINMVKIEEKEVAVL